jgi:hypothetical protein
MHDTPNCKHKDPPHAPLGTQRVSFFFPVKLIRLLDEQAVGLRRTRTEMLIWILRERLVPQELVAGSDKP